MKTFALVAVLLVGIANQASAANPELNHWYNTYTAFQNGMVCRTYSPLNVADARLELHQIMRQYPFTQHHIVRVANTGGLGDFVDSWDGPFGPADEAQQLLEWMWALPAYRF